MLSTPRIFQSFLGLIFSITCIPLSAGCGHSRPISPETPLSYFLKKIEADLKSPRNEYLHAFLFKLNEERLNQNSLIIYLTLAINHIDEELKKKPELDEPEEGMPKYSFMKLEIDKALKTITAARDLEKIKAALMLMQKRLIEFLNLIEGTGNRR